MAVDLPLAKQHLRVTHDTEDALIETYLAAAKAWVEKYTGKKLTRGTVTQDLPAFTPYLPLFWGPDPADLTITYTDTTGASQTIVDAVLSDDRVWPAHTWPSVSLHKPVRLEYTAGFVETPSDLDSAVLLLVGHYYANREAVVADTSVAELPMAVEALCQPYRRVLV